MKLKIIYLILCVLFWGFTYFLEKLAVEKLNAWWIQVYYGFIIGVVSVFLMFFLGIKNNGITFDKNAVIYLIISALTAIIGNIFFFMSIKSNVNAGSFIVASNAYVIVVMILSAIFLSESITLLKFLSICVILAGNVLLIYSK